MDGSRSSSYESRLHSTDTVHEAGSYGSYELDSAPFLPHTLDPESSEVIEQHQTTPRIRPVRAYNLSEAYRNPGDVSPSPAPQHHHIHGQAPGLKRYTTRKVKLTRGSVLSFDYPVPSAIRNAIQPKYRDSGSETDPEFCKLRYTAVTTDPNDFTLQNGYDLRPRMFNRHTEHLVCVTYYDEDKVLLSRTLHSLFENIRDIYNLKKTTFWNKGGVSWQKMVVCIVMDGIAACDKAVLDVLATMGLYQDGILVKEVDGVPVTAHVLECTTQLSVTPEQQLIRPLGDDPSTLPPVQLMLCLKTKNAGKINSYRWIYNAFGRILNPEIVSNIDTGTYLKPRALLGLWEAFYNDKDLGAACGALHVDLGKRWQGLLNPLVATQNFEYKVAVQVERAMEAASGYLSVLPGAFSGYRFRAAIGRPLEEYFYGDPTLRKSLGSKAPASVFRLNRFLADDRILAFELVVKAGQKWHTTLVSDAKAYTDVPSNTTDFINQRRRWLNGAFAATLYSHHMFQLLPKSGHNIVRMPILMIQLLHNMLAFLFAWFSLSGFLLTTFIVNDVSGSPPEGTPVDGFPFGSGTPIVNAVIQIVYIITVVFQFVLALGSRPKSQVTSYIISFSIFAIIQAYLIMNLIYLTKRLVDFKQNNNGGSSYAFINEYYADIGYVTVFVTAVSVFGVYIVAGFLALDPWHLFTSWAQYMFVSTAYINILNIYAFSNIHDVSWGQKTGKGGPNGYKILDFAEVTVNKVQGRPEATVESIDRSMEDIDSQFEETVRRALTPHVRDTEPESDDLEGKFMKFRTILVMVYIFSNFLVCMIVLDQTFQGFYLFGDPYWHKIWFFRIWMWGNSSLFIMKFVGMIWYQCHDRVIRLLFYRR